MSNPSDKGPSTGTIRAAHNSAFLLGSQSLTKLTGFAIVVMLVRYLDVGDFGIYSLALAVTGMMDILAELGLDLLSIREIARNHDNIKTYTANAVAIKLILSLLVLAATAAIIFFRGLDGGSGTVFLVFTLAIIPTGIFHSLLVVFMGIERMAVVAAGSIVYEIIRLILTVAVLMTGHGLVALAWSYMIALILATLPLYVLVRIQAGPVWARPDFRRMLSMARGSVPFMFYSLFFLIYFKIDFIMLAAMKGEEAVGTYAAAYRLMESLMFVPAAFTGAVFPTLSRLSAGGSASVLAASRKTLRYMAMLGLPIGFGTTVLAPRIVPFLFGDAYLGSVLPLQIIIWSIVLVFLNSICPAGLNSSDRQLANVLVTGTGILVNVAVNLVLIPSLGAVGTSIATVITELVTTVLFLYYFRRYIGSLGLFSRVYRPLAAALAMTLGLLLFNFLPLPVLIAGGAVFYLVSLILLRALRRSDLELATRLLRPAAAVVEPKP